MAVINHNKAAGRDDALVEQIKNMGFETKWLLTMIKICFTQNEIPKI